MKINVEFDLTPAEFRQAMGLPDVEPFQKALMERIQKQMDAGVEGYDPMQLMQPFLQQPSFLQQPLFKEGMAQGFASFGNYQQMMLDMLRQAGNPNTSSPGGNTAEATAGEDASSTSESRARKQGPAAAQSRSKRQS
ncbi:DUF6489 family protein [Litchfieldella xinjiangensis]|uniref:DUF6489 family protein n=1 Tax=Litchfieldella xinjiangensis TaxID=1166948 RepID=UPI0005BCEEB9|nr:DUF6489 family protein [Halomonas xinjiangensis]